MKDCRKNRESMSSAAGAPEAPGPGVKEHLAMCDECRHEFDDVQKILAGAEAVRAEMDKAMASVDWDGLSEKIVDAAWSGARPKPAARPVRAWFAFYKGLFAPPLRGVFAGVAAGVLLGAVATYFILQGGPRRTPGPLARSYAASGEFIDRVEYEMARRETIDYLEKSEYVILDLVQPLQERPTATAPTAVSDRIKSLLSKKRYFNPRLDDAGMQKARRICDQIEMLFIELSQLSTDLSAAEAAQLQKYVEDQQILLKIRLLKKELRETGV
jgi:hypothetical protein